MNGNIANRNIILVLSINQSTPLFVSYKIQFEIDLMRYDDIACKNDLNLSSEQRNIGWKGGLSDG